MLGTKKKPRKKKTVRRASISATADRRPSAAALRVGLHLSRQDFARLSGFSVRKIADLEKEVATKASTERRLAELRRLQQGLARTMKAEFVGEWLRTPNGAFDGLKPIEVIERGEVDRLWRMIYLLEAGLPI